MLALLIMAALMIMCLGLLNLTVLDLNVAGAHRGSKAAFYAAEAGIEQAVVDIMSKFDVLDVYTNSAVEPGADADGYLTISNFNGYTVKYKITNPLDRFLYTTVIGATTTSHYAYTYDIEVTASIPDGPSETLKERIRILETPLVQYFVFWGGTGPESNLQWLPHPPMNSWGRIHVNGNLCVGITSGNTISIRNYDDSSILCPHSISVGGSIIRQDSIGGGRGSVTGKVRVKVRNLGTTTISDADCELIQRNSNMTVTEARFNDYVLVGVDIFTGITTQSIQRGDFYEQRAENPRRPTVDGIKIVGRSTTGGIRVFVSRPAYTEVTTLVNNAEVAAGVATGSAGGTTVITPGTMVQETTSPRNDYREGKSVIRTEIDLNLLEDWYVQYLDYQSDSVLGNETAADVLAGDGILVYASRSPTTGYAAEATLHAIKLAKSTVPQLLDETTLVTDNPLYVEGDFNTASRRGCALICDSVNILSNNWETKQGGKSPPSGGGFSNPTETTVNAAFVGGNVPPTHITNDYEGGLENYPRLHENWSTGGAVPCNIKGCFISLWQSVQAPGNWAYYSPHYTAPQRNWGWDLNFQDHTFWPPFVPSFFSIERVGWKE